ncbi:MAG: hypothetical protein HOQ45_20510, partial [Nocardioidaceae bacterium]|nr:hypothetical protein [Nocardioidaceae bacterium]
MRARGWGWVAVLVAALLTAGCSGQSPHDAHQAAPKLVRTAADRTACAEVQRVFLHLAVLSGHWDRERQPFDRTTAAAFNPLNHELRDQARTASTRQLRVAIERNADALGALTEAMDTHRAGQVRSALSETRRAYAALPACAHSSDAQLRAATRSQST